MSTQAPTQDAPTAADAIAPGTLVRYTGTHADVHGVYLCVPQTQLPDGAAAEPGRYRLHCTFTGDLELANVRRESVTPLETVFELCDCGHAVNVHLPSGHDEPVNACSAIGCFCHRAAA